MDSLVKKLLLAIAAMALNLSLAIGGTLMLCTDTQTTVNVMTFGSLHIRLDENVGKNGVMQQGPVVGGGYDWTNLLPGDVINKEPYVTHTGGTDAYLRVKAVLRYDGWDQLSQAKQQAILDFVNDGIVSTLGDTWVCVPADGFAAANTAVYFYYTPDYVDPQRVTFPPLAVFSQGDVTPPVFASFTIPEDYSSDMIADVTFDIDLTAQAVQTAHNGYDFTPGAGAAQGDYEAALAAAFAVFGNN
ncbi:MAG: hypothetical protein FWF44_07220 [Defluviitaleaceae bacterium]|nr:hypothetical protein [Defluviitaleaceae bacterium]